MNNAGLSISTLLIKYKKELQDELSGILSYWRKYMPDNQNGGFYGSVSMDNIPDTGASKGIVMNSRMLWAFSAATLTGKYDYKDMADRAFNYIISHFIDYTFGGVYWSLYANGSPKETKKQIYGIAFCIYGLTEYYKLCKDDSVLQYAVNLFEIIEKYSFDQEYNGYIEAFACDWKPLEDLRLSDKDDNEQKTMNTHLHIIEAYANLYKVWPSEVLSERIINLLDIFKLHIIDRKSGHLHLFMDEKWNVKSSVYSFGHEIEASWLLLECAGKIRDKKKIRQFEKIAVALAQSASQGLSDVDGSLYYEFNFINKKYIKEKHWWVQAEAMIGFFNAWEIEKDTNLLLTSLKVWDFIKANLRDQDGGEWYWGMDEHNHLMEEDKAGFWKCPYHNGRACMELIKRIDKILND